MKAKVSKHINNIALYRNGWRFYIEEAQLGIEELVMMTEEERKLFHHKERTFVRCEVIMEDDRVLDVKANGRYGTLESNFFADWIYENCQMDYDAYQRDLMDIQNLLKTVYIQ